MAMLRQTLLMLAFLLSTSALSAEQLRVTVADYSDSTQTYFNTAAAAFEDINPDTEVQIEVVAWSVMLEKLKMEQALGNTPDLSIIGTPWLLDFVQDGKAEPLDDYMSEDFREQFLDIFLSPSTMNGKTYGLPIAASARAMYYNKELFERAGIESPPATWIELSETARKISALGDDISGFGLQGSSTEVDIYFYYALWAYGGEVIEKDGTSGLDTEAAYEAAELYRSMIESGATQAGVNAYSKADLQVLFKQGKIGMMITSPVLSNQIKSEVPELPYGISAIPAGPHGDRGTYAITDSIIMFENSRLKSTAWKFLELLFTEEWRGKFNKAEGFLPVNKALANSPEYSDDPDLSAFTALLPEARFAPVINDWKAISLETSDTLQRIYQGDAEIKPSLDATAAYINQFLQQ